MVNQLIGIGLRHPHYQQVLDERPPIGWLEVHSENFFHTGGASIEMLTAIRSHYPLSLHGVGLSLGSAGGISRTHLAAIKQLMERVEPFRVSEHLSWSRVGDVVMPDLLPIPYTKESLEIFCRNVNQAQDYLGRELLIENPSSYLEYKTTELNEMDFLVELCERTGARILLDVNNIFVSSCNHGWDAKAYIDAIPGELVKEMHLAGHSLKTIAADQIVRIDTHDQCVCPEVWELYAYAIAKIGAKPTLLEWDAEIPALSVLILEANKAQNYLPIDQNAYEHA
ncbi:MAG: DUF692 domain-containing protein [Pseudomonadota bacterium]|nr:DUF692 domain-containing protein [Pseudomonadota bacterium]